MSSCPLGLPCLSQESRALASFLCHYWLQVVLGVGVGVQSSHGDCSPQQLWGPSA